MRLALGQMEVIPGRPDLNTSTILDMVEEARQGGAQMVIFPEMAVPGYLLGDTWEQDAFIRDCEEYGRQIIQSSRNGICVLFGNVAADWDKTGDDGRVRKYNAFFIAKDGVLHGGDNFPYPYRIKTLQPNTQQFDDTRHFYSLRKLAMEMGKKVEELLQPVKLTVAGQTLKLGCLLCEDGWSENYYLKPIDVYQQNGPVDLFINISSSPFTSGKNNKRNRVFSRQALDTGVPLIYVNNVGIQNNGKTVYTYDGNSTVYNSRGQIIDYCPAFSPELKILDLDLETGGRNREPVSVPGDSGIDVIYQAITYGISKFMSSIGINKVIIGLSGGIDSAVTACLYTLTLGPENVLLVNMPSIFNSQTTRSLSARLAENLGCLYTVMPIQDSVDYTAAQISQTPVVDLKSGREFKIPVTPFVLENIQARDRSARILAGLAAAFGGAFTCNSNKSEMTVGYSTLYGDLAGFLAALGDLWKHQVYDLALYLNQEVFRKEVIPQGIIDLVPSAELSPDQAVEEGKGDPIIYPYHDYLFRAFMEHWQRATPEDILTWYVQGSLEERIGCR
ncbi:MAG TPA: NAD(+) synthase, partial [Bacillota bacterium]|nr:NAD(+) synthase [Bacillota bacterium]